MGKEIKRETDWLGREKDVIYEDGVKVGETRREEGISGSAKYVTRDTSGRKVSETKWEEGFFGGKFVTHDPSGQKLSETRRETDLLGRERYVVYQEGQKIGELRKEQGMLDAIFGVQKKVLHETSGKDVDLTTRTLREENEETGRINNWATCAYCGESFEGDECECGGYGSYDECPRCNVFAFDGHECVMCGFDGDSESLQNPESEIAEFLDGKSSSELMYIAIDPDKPPEIRKTAVDRITDPNTLATIAQFAVNPESPEVRIAACRRITDQDMLNYIAKSDPNPDVGIVAVARIKDKSRLKYLTFYGFCPDVRKFAEKKFNGGST